MAKRGGRKSLTTWLTSSGSGHSTDAQLEIRLSITGPSNTPPHSRFLLLHLTLSGRFLLVVTRLQLLSAHPLLSRNFPNVGSMNRPKTAGELHAEKLCNDFESQ